MACLFARERYPPSMLLAGTLREWNDEKGYGYIHPEDGSRAVFAHINEFKPKYPRPRDGDRVEYRLGTDSTGRVCAKHIHRPMLRNVPPASSPLWLPITVSAAYLVWMGVQTHRGVYPPGFGLALVFMSGVSYLRYAADKRRALRRVYRIPEGSLLLLDLLGGWPGGLIAQRHLRHKTSKAFFRVVFFLFAALNIGLVHYLAARPGWWWTGSYRVYFPALLERVQGHLQGLVPR